MNYLSKYDVVGFFTYFLQEIAALFASPPFVYIFALICLVFVAKIIRVLIGH